MYNLISAVAKPLHGNGRWQSVDIGGVALNTLFSTYSRIIATLSNPFLDKEVALDLAGIRSMAVGPTQTFEQFLVENGDKTLPTIDQLPILKDRYAKYADAFHAGYRIRPVHPTASIDAPMPPSEKTWLHLSREDTDYTDFYQSCLVNINGFFHLTDADTTGVYVKDGMKSSRLSGENQIAIYSFRDLGNLEFIPISDDNMLYKQNDRQTLKHRAFVDLGRDVSDKTVMLVLGGYLHVLDGHTFYRVSESMFAIDFENLPFLDRYFESKKNIDLSSMPMSKTSRNKDQISVSELYSDDNIKAYLKLSQSFFVILDNADIFSEFAALPETTIPNMYVSYEVPQYPLLVGAGKAAPYWYVPEDGRFSLTTVDALKPNPLYDTVDAVKQMSVSNQCDPERPYSCSPGYFLKVGTSLS